MLQRIPSTPGFFYRAATSADVPAMERSRAVDLQAGGADARMAAYLDGQHHPQQALAPRIAFVALTGNDVAGYIAAHATTRHGCSGEVQYLYVAPQFRRYGVARRLLRFVARWFHDQGIHRVCVNADVESAAAVGFYTAEGAVPLNKYWYVWDSIDTLLGTNDGPANEHLPQLVDPDAFAKWSGRDLSEQEVEVFACRRCEGIVIGLPDEHSVYFDPTEPQRTSFYNRSGRIRCPLCRVVWYEGGMQEYEVRTVSREEFSSSAWAWLSLVKT